MVVCQLLNSASLPGIGLAKTSIYIAVLPGRCLALFTRGLCISEQEPRPNGRGFIVYNTPQALPVRAGFKLRNVELQARESRTRSDHLTGRDVSASGFVHNHFDAARCEFSFDVTGQKPLGFLLSPQDCIHVAKRESTHK